MSTPFRAAQLGRVFSAYNSILCSLTRTLTLSLSLSLSLPLPLTLTINLTLALTLTLTLTLTLALTLTREEGCRVAHITSGRERRLRGGNSEALGHA